MIDFNKTHRTEFGRKFLLAALPETITPADPHLQIFDNYIEGTRIRLRMIRIPEKNAWSRFLQQCIPSTSDAAARAISEIELNNDEYRVFERFRGREIRKNRYVFKSNERRLEVDVYLGKLRGLLTLTASFENAIEAKDFEPPASAVTEITGESFFSGQVLVDKSFADVRHEFKNLREGAPKSKKSGEDI